jgi:hypothetical protein
MRPTGSIWPGLGLALLVLVSAAAASPTFHFVWRHELGTQLLWSSDDAYLVIRTRTTGWHGGIPGLLWQMFRNAGGVNTETTDALEAIEMIRYSRRGLDRTTVYDLQVSRFIPVEDRLIAAVDGQLSRWTGVGFEPAPPADAAYFRSAVVPLGNYDEVRGWSGRANLLYWGQPDTRHRLAVAGRQLEIRVKAPSGFRDKELALAIDGSAPEVIWALRSERTDVGEAEYQASFKPPQP